MKIYELKGNQVLLKAYDKKRRVGYIKGIVFVAPRRKSKHFFRKYNGWALSRELIDFLWDLGITDILIDSYEEDCYYAASIMRFKELGIPYKADKVFDAENKKIRSFEEQLVLPIQYFTKIPKVL